MIKLLFGMMIVVLMCGMSGCTITTSNPNLNGEISKFGKFKIGQNVIIINELSVYEGCSGYISGDSAQFYEVSLTYCPYASNYYESINAKETSLQLKE